MATSERVNVQHERQAEILERIATNAPLQGTLDELVSHVESQIAGAIGAMLLMEPDGRRLRYAAGRGLSTSIHALAPECIDIGPCNGSCGTAAFRREPVFCEDLLTDPLWAEFHHAATSYGLRACWSFPILSRRRAQSKRVLGTFAVYFRTPRLPEPHHIEILNNAESLACIALETHYAVRELQESDARLRMFVDHATDAFFVFDGRSGAVLEINQQACDSLGYSRDELLGSSVSLFDRTATPERVDEMHRRLSIGEIVTFDSFHVRRDGSAFPVEVRARRFETRGQVFHLAMARDTTARRELEDQLRHAQKMEAVGRLAGGVAHDFNNLLTVINGYSDVLLDQIPEDSPEHADLAMIRDAGDRAAALTAQLLAFSRRTIIAPKALNLNVLVERLVKMCKRLIGEHISLKTQLAPELATVMADAGQIEQVVMNLVVNARDAMPRGGTLTISTRHQALAGTSYVCLAVSDTGEGMTDDVRARVFEPFFTTKPQGQGSGLGLATAYGIVEQANGQIHVDSSPGEGSTFSVLLPMIDGAEEAMPRITRQRPRGTETVLLAEDEDAVRRLVQRALELHGYSVLPARNGEEAQTIERAHGGPIHMLVTDVVMPGMGGRELADTLKSRRPQLKVLYMSGYTNDEVVRHGVIVARDAFLQKPFTPTSLVAMVRATFAGSAERKSSEA
ncbi:MAG TPA: ATP-binding protein [Kofleriaceae bacterium]|nr:ATP-binding protein [Kofleriaceae bacterium]